MKTLLTITLLPVSAIIIAVAAIPVALVALFSISWAMADLIAMDSNQPPY